GAVEAAVAKHAVGAGNLDRGPEGGVSPPRLAVGDDAVGEAEGGDRMVALRVPLREAESVGVETLDLAEVPAEGIALVDHESEDDTAALLDVGEPGRALHDRRIEAGAANHRYLGERAGIALFLEAPFLGA